MMRQKLLLAGLAAVTPVVVNAALAQQVKFAADAEFYALDSSGCVSSHIFFFVRNGKTRDSKESAKAKVEMTVVQTDECRNQILLEARAKTNLKNGEVEFSPALDGAMVDAVIQMRDAQSKNAVTADVLVNWVAVDEPETLDATFEVEGPGRIEKRPRRIATTLRLAEASGTISLDGGANLIPGSSADAAMQRAE